MLRCHETWLSFLIQHVAASLRLNPPPKRGIGSVLLWHEAVTELYLEFKQLFKVCAPSVCQTISLASPPVETNTIECSNALLCHGTWLSFLMPPVAASLLLNPPPELGVGSVPLCHETVAELRLEFA
jgi:hypothetical protein